MSLKKCGSPSFSQQHEAINLLRLGTKHGDLGKQSAFRKIKLGNKITHAVP